MTEPILRGTGLTKHYGGVVAVDDVSLQLAPGEVLGLVGPNGAGKTTLVDLITGAQTATAGELLLKGVPLTGPAARRSRLGLARTFQHPLLALDLSVRDNLIVGVAARRQQSASAMIASLLAGILRSERHDDHERAAEIATEVRLDGDLNRLCRDLTLGEQRLLEVGRALAQDPVVLLLDEPFAGADPDGIEGIIGALRIVQRRGHGVVLVDHNVDLVASVVDRIMLLDQGQVRFDGDPAECLASPEMQAVYFGTKEDADVT